MLRQIAELALAVLCATALIAGSAVFCIDYAMPQPARLAPPSSDLMLPAQGGIPASLFSGIQPQSGQPVRIRFRRPHSFADEPDPVSVERDDPET